MFNRVCTSFQSKVQRQIEPAKRVSALVDSCWVSIAIYTLFQKFLSAVPGVFRLVLKIHSCLRVVHFVVHELEVTLHLHLKIGFLICCEVAVVERLRSVESMALGVCDVRRRGTLRGWRPRVSSATLRYEW